MPCFSCRSQQSRGARSSSPRANGRHTGTLQTPHEAVLLYNLQIAQRFCVEARYSRDPRPFWPPFLVGSCWPFNCKKHFAHSVVGAARNSACVLACAAVNGCKILALFSATAPSAPPSPSSTRHRSVARPRIVAVGGTSLLVGTRSSKTGLYPPC